MNRFVAIDVSLGDNPKVRRFARELFGSNKLALAATAGCLTMLLGHCKISAPSGDITDVDDSLLEEWAHWPGKPGVFAAAFRARFAADGVLHDWDDWNGKLIGQQLANIKKCEDWRKKKAAYRNGGNGSNGGPRTVRERFATGVENGSQPVPERGPERFENSSRTANQPTIPTNQPPHTPTPPKKKLAAGTEKPPAAAESWLVPVASAWEYVNGSGSFPWGQAGKLLKPLQRAGLSGDEIGIRLGNYLACRWGDKFNNLKDFADHHGQYSGKLVDDFGVPTDLGRRVAAGDVRRLSA